MHHNCFYLGYFYNFNLNYFLLDIKFYILVEFYEAFQPTNHFVFLLQILLW